MDMKMVEARENNCGTIDQEKKGKRMCGNGDYKKVSKRKIKYHTTVKRNEKKDWK